MLKRFADGVSLCRFESVQHELINTQFN